ncbi:pre-rRNA processing protein [Orbilia oligospora]|uniref:Pre-rRNA processing protein n=1 Tax=Orbilia oligospora TaxID=2813651 RepID=A0A8H8VI51_ORBOL|nr:pre-rRNA processing protein [Orbilia oligospora]
MSSFFTAPASQRKRKRSGTDTPANSSRKASGTAKPPSKKRQVRDEEISSDDDDSIDSASIASAEDSDDESILGETEAEKRLRLAQQYLDNLRTETEEHGFDAADIDRDLIAERLKSSVAETHGKLYRHIATSLSFSTSSPIQFRHAFQSTTSVAICHPYIYTTTKDVTLIKWKFPTSVSSRAHGGSEPVSQEEGLKPKQIRCVRGSRTRGNRPTDATYQGHIDTILCVAASPDGNCSSDRTIKLWSLDELTYVETLFGHQDEVMAIDSLAYERCVTVGARDKSARLWKIVDETQLVFRGGGEGKVRRRAEPEAVQEVGYTEGSIDCVCMVDEEHFVTGSDNGSISLWSLHKKKPVFTIRTAHGLRPSINPADHSAEANPEDVNVPRQPYYITALAAIPYSDVFFSGSWDGCIRVWKISEDKRSIESAGMIGVGAEGQEAEEGGVMLDETELRTPFRGVVNSLAVYEKNSGREDESCVVIAGIGQEMRMGRWLKIKGRNAAVMFVVDRVGRKVNGTS